VYWDPFNIPHLFHPFQYTCLIPFQLSNHSVHRDACNDNPEQPQALWTGWHTGEEGGKDERVRTVCREREDLSTVTPISIKCILLHDISRSLEDVLNDLQKVQFTLKTGHERVIHAFLLPRELEAPCFSGTLVTISLTHGITPHNNSLQVFFTIKIYSWIKLWR